MEHLRHLGLDPRSWSRDQREIRLGAAIIFLIVSVTFSPFLYGGLTLQDSVTHAQSLYATGSRQPPPSRYSSYTVIDAGAPAWQTEPEFALEHYLVTHERTAPVWNDYSAFGAPFAANMQSAVYSPFSIIPTTFSNARAYDFYVAARIFAAGFLAFLFVRQFAGFLPALVGGAAYMFTGYLWLYITMPNLNVEALVPGMLYATERLLRKPGPGTTALFAVLMGCSVLGGMPEATALAITFTYLYFAFRAVSDVPLRRRFKSWAPYALAASALGAGLSAILVLPFLEYVPLSRNFHTQGAGAGTLSDPWSFQTLASYLAPLFQGPPWNFLFGAHPWSGFAYLRGFFGCATTYFALVAIFSQIDDRVRHKASNGWPVAFFAVVACAVMMKRFGFVAADWIGHLPVLRFVILYQYGEAITACCAAVLAGFGVARVIARNVSAAALWWAAFLPLSLLTVAAAIDRPAFSALQEHRQYYVLGLGAALAFLLIASGTAWGVRSRRLAPAVAGIAALALVVVEPAATYYVPMYFFANQEAPQSASTLLGAPYVDYLKEHLGGDRFFAEDNLFYPEWSAAFQVRDVRALDALYVERYLPFVAAFLKDPYGDGLASRFTGGGGDDLRAPLAQRFLSLSSVRYVGTGVPIADPQAFRLALTVPGSAYFYEYASPLPRVSAYRRVRHAADGATALALLAQPDFDPKAEAVVEGPTTPELQALTAAAPAPVAAGKIIASSSRSVRASVTLAGSGLVVFNDTNYPGWSATVDGQPVEILAANYLFRGIVVGPGTHEIDFSYRPLSFVIGSAVSLLSLLVIVVLSVAPRLRRPEATP